MISYFAEIDLLGSFMGWDRKEICFCFFPVEICCLFQLISVLHFVSFMQVLRLLLICGDEGIELFWYQEFDKHWSYLKEKVVSKKQTTLDFLSWDSRILYINLAFHLYHVQIYLPIIFLFHNLHMTTDLTATSTRTVFFLYDKQPLVCLWLSKLFKILPFINQTTPKNFQVHQFHFAIYIVNSL